MNTRGRGHRTGHSGHPRPQTEIQSTQLQTAVPRFPTVRPWTSLPSSPLILENGIKTLQGCGEHSRRYKRHALQGNKVAQEISEDWAKANWMPGDKSRCPGQLSSVLTGDQDESPPTAGSTLNRVSGWRHTSELTYLHHGKEVGVGRAGSQK